MVGLRILMISGSILTIGAFTLNQLWNGFSSFDTVYVGWWFMFVSTSRIVKIRNTKFRRLALLTGTAIIVSGILGGRWYEHSISPFVTIFEILLLCFAIFVVMLEFEILFKVVD